MKRVLSTNLVVLPQLDGYSALTVVRGILTRVHATVAKLREQKQKLPALVLAAVKKLEVAYAALQQAVGQQKTTTEARDQRTVHFELVNAWGAFYDWLQSFSRLRPARAERGQAAVVQERLFPDGLLFVKLKYGQAWAAGETKLVAAGEGNLEDIVTALGGKVFLEEVQALHKEYGSVLGVTTVVDTTAQDNVVQTGPALNEARAALRKFVMRVSGHVDDEDPESEAQAEYLLAPLMDFEGPARVVAADETQTPPGASAKPPTEQTSSSGATATEPESTAELSADKKAPPLSNGHDSGEPAGH